MLVGNVLVVRAVTSFLNFLFFVEKGRGTRQKNLFQMGGAKVKNSGSFVSDFCGVSVHVCVCMCVSVCLSAIASEVSDIETSF